MEPEPYNLIITGGTGARQGAIGGGQITVSPSLSGSTSREPWSFNLYLNRQMRNPDTPILLAEVSGTSNLIMIADRVRQASCIRVASCES
jgi:hypothetical protein